VTTFREFWARSGHFGQNGGWDEFRGARVFLCGNPEDHSVTLQWPIFTKFCRETQFGVLSRNPERHFRKFSLYGSFAPKSEIKNRSNRHLTQSRLQVMGCTAERYCSLRSRPMARDFRGMVNFSLRSTVAELQGVKVAQFSDFGLFSLY